MTSITVSGRRYLVAAGTSLPAVGGLARLPAVGENVDRVAGLFSSLGYVRVLADLGREPTAAGLKFGLEDWLSSPERRPDDILVLYYAGYSAQVEGRHYLLCADSHLDRLGATAIPASDLALMLADNEEHGRVLVIVDTAPADPAQARVGDLAELAREFAMPSSQPDTNLWLIAAARADDDRVGLGFADALAAVLAAPRAGARQPFIELSEVTERVDACLDDNRPQRGPHCVTVGPAGLSPFFPNSNFVSDLPPVQLNVEALARMRRERKSHFDPRARGREYASEVGNYFVGRTAALTELARWLASPAHDRRARVITGDPGSGKSAVLGRLILLAESADVPSGTPPETMPPQGSITTHLHLHRRTLEDTVFDLAVALGETADSLEDLLVGLRARSTPCTLLLDGLDEAGTAGEQTEATLIARELLRPLSSLPQVRLIVGTRRGPISSIGSAIEIIDLDTEDYTGPEDVADYVRALLLSDDNPSPYRQDADWAAALAEGIADRAGRSFLVAYMTARALINGQVDVDVGQPDWQRTLPSEVDETFAAYLARFEGDERRVRRLLTPLAYADGDGLPWDNLWAPLATALSGEPCSDDDIGWLFEHAGAYILDVPIEDRSVFRLYHEALADYLCDPRRTHEAHRRITRTLLNQVPVSDGRRQWQLAHPYIRTNLASHAAAANLLDELVLDPDFLVHADPVALLPVIRQVTSRAARNVCSIYCASVSAHRDASTTARRQILAFDAARYQAPDLARTLSSSLSWRVRWTTGSQVSAALQMSWLEESHGVQGAACIVIDQSMRLVTAGIDGSLRIWDLANGNPSGYLRGHTGEVNAVCCTYLRQQPVAISGGSDGTVRLWDLKSESERLTLTGHVGRVNALACATVKGRPVAITGGDDRTIRLWDLETGSELVTMTGHARGIRAVALAEIDGSAVAVSGASDSTVRVWDLPGGTARAVLKGHSGEVNAVTCTVLDGEPVILSGGDDRTVRLWDLRGQGQRSVFTGDMDWIRAIDCMTLNGRPIFVCGTDGATAHIWDMRTRVQLATFTGHGHWVRAVVCSQTAGRGIVITAAADGAVCVWDPNLAVEQVLRAGHSGEVNAVASATVGGRATVVSGGDDRVVRLWDLSTGEHLAAMTGHTGLIRAIATTELTGRAIAITGSSDGMARVWDLADRNERAVLTGHTDWISAVADTVLRGRPVAVTAGDDCAVRIWDLSKDGSDTELAVLSGHTGGVNAVACTTLDGRPVAVTGACDGSVRVWDLETGNEQAMLTGHAGWVRAVACTTIGDRPLVVSGGDDQTIRIWDLRSGQQQTDLRGANSGINTLVCTVIGDRPTVLAGSLDRTVRAWDMITHEAGDTLTLPYPVWSLAVGPAGQFAIGAGREVCVYDHIMSTT